MGNVIQAKTFQLQAPIGSTDTTIAVKNFEDIYGGQIFMSGIVQYATLEPESQSNQEIISFTGITLVSANIWNLTGVTRGLDAQPTNGIYGNDPAQGKAHASSVDCILSDSPQVWDDKASKSEDEEVTGAWTFDISPIVPTPDSTFEAANKDYVDNSVAAGASDSTTTTIGISRQSYSPTVTIGTATMTIASPCVVTFTSHGLTLNDSIQFTTTGALPTGLLPSTTYYVISTGLTANTFQLATTRGGTAINTTGSQSGTHTLYKTTPIAVNTNDPRLPTQDENDALVGTSGVAVSSSNKLVDNADKRLFTGYFGDGSDGDVIVNSGSFSSGPITTNVLTRDAYFNNLTINDTFTLNTGGYKIFVLGTLTQVGTGKISNNAVAAGGNGGAGGNGISDGATATAGTAGTAGTSALAVTVPAPITALAGVAGANSPAGAQVTGTAGTAGTATTASVKNGSASSVAGVAGGTGGTGSSGAGGTGGTAGAAGTVVKSTSIVNYLDAYNFSSWISGVFKQFQFNAGNGASGGGGNGRSASGGGFSAGGGGGGSGGNGGDGGFIAIYANSITTASNPLVTCTGANGGNGGNGGNGLAGGNNGGGGGGGGGSGGNGGLAVILYKTLLAGTITGTVTGGAGGAGGAGGTGTSGGTNGSAGATGNNGVSGLLISIIA